jgi:hypothetical protein
MLAAETFAERQRAKGSTVLFAPAPCGIHWYRDTRLAGRVSLREVQDELHVEEP